MLTTRDIFERMIAASIAAGSFAIPGALMLHEPTITQTVAAHAPVRSAVLSVISFPSDPPAAPDDPTGTSDKDVDVRDSASDASPSPDRTSSPDTTDSAGQLLATRALRTPNSVPLYRADRPSTKASSSPRKRRVAKRKRGCLKPDPRIVAIDSTTFSIDRDLIERYTGDLDAASKLAWVGWHHDTSGRIDGFTVRRIRCGSLLHQAGFRNGDVIHEINGQRVTSVFKALRAYRKLRKRRRLEVQLTRAGEERKLNYQLG